jgi:hypothetical protein
MLKTAFLRNVRDVKSGRNVRDVKSGRNVRDVESGRNLSYGAVFSVTARFLY